MINIRVILLSFMCGSLIKPYSGYVTFFSVYSACLSFHFDFGACQLCCLIDLTLCKISQAMVPLGPWLSSPDSVHSLTCRGGGDPGSTRGLRVSDLLPFLYVIRSISDQLMDLNDVDLILASLVRDPSPSCTALQSSDRQINMPFVLYSHW